MNIIKRVILIRVLTKHEPFNSAALLNMLTKLHQSSSITHRENKEYLKTFPVELMTSYSKLTGFHFLSLFLFFSPRTFQPRTLLNVAVEITIA